MAIVRKSIDLEPCVAEPETGFDVPQAIATSNDFLQQFAILQQKIVCRLIIQWKSYGYFKVKAQEKQEFATKRKKRLLVFL